MHAPRVAPSLPPALVMASVLLLAGVGGCAERESPPPPPEAAVPSVQAPESVSATPDTLVGDSIMARDTLWIPE